MAENQEMAGEDASLDAAVDKIMSMGSEKWSQDLTKLDRLEQNVDSDVTHADGTTDLEVIERDESAKAETDKVDAKGDGEDAESETTYIELPSDEEGKEGERIPIAEAVEAVKQYRQMQGDVAQAVIKAEEAAYQKQDEVTRQLSQTFDVVRQQARLTLEAMSAYLPQAPDPIMLDRNAGYYDPEGYHVAKLHFDNFKAHEARLQDTLQRADQGRSQTFTHQEQEQIRRENERIARYIPEWKDDKGRTAFKSKVLEALGPKYGITVEDLADIVDHKAWRIIADLSNAVTTEKKAPEIRKAVQAKAPKLVNGRAPATERDSNGRFVNEARNELKKSGTEDAFANFILRSGVTRRK